MQLLRRSQALRFLLVCFLSVASLDRAIGGAAIAEPMTANDVTGIRFQVAVSIKAAPTFALANDIREHDKASLSATVRISSHATGSQFYGEVTKEFLNFSILKGSSEQVFWQDPGCHQRRGLPKTTVIAVNGSIAIGKGGYDVQAVARQLGLRLPFDEVAAATKLPPGIDGPRRFIGFRSETKRSLLFVDVKIYEVDCDLRGG
jgi:hypothetical protein